MLARGPQIVEATAGGELHNVKPFTPEVRAEIDNELVAKSVDFMRRQTSAGKPFFLYLPFSMGHIPNLPSGEFRGKSRIGNYGDKLMEGDYHVGQILDAIKQLGVDDNTLLVFASDNGPSGEAAAAQLTVDRQIEHGEVSGAALDHQSGPNGPEVLWP